MFLCTSNHSVFVYTFQHAVIGCPWFHSSGLSWTLRPGFVIGVKMMLCVSVWNVTELSIKGFGPRLFGAESQWPSLVYSTGSVRDSPTSVCDRGHSVHCMIVCIFVSKPLIGLRFLDSVGGRKQALPMRGSLIEMIDVEKSYMLGNRLV